MQTIQIMAATGRGSTECGDGGRHQQQLAGLDLLRDLALLLQLLLQVILPVVGLLVDRSVALVHQQQKQQQKRMIQAVQVLRVVLRVALQEMRLQEVAAGARHLLQDQAAEVTRGARRRTLVCVSGPVASSLQRSGTPRRTGVSGWAASIQQSKLRARMMQQRGGYAALRQI
jgi:hypothetical protein